MSANMFHPDSAGQTSKLERPMTQKDILALAAAIALSVAMSQSFPAKAAEPVKAGLDLVVVPPKPAAAAAAAPTKAAAGTPPLAATAAAPAPAGPSQPAPAAVAVKLPAPQFSMPASAPVISVEMPAAKPAVAITEAVPAKPVDNTQTASVPADAPKAKAANAAEKPVKLKKKLAKVKAVEVKADAGPVVQRPAPKFFFGLFDAPKPELDPLSEEQVQNDIKIASVPEKKKFKVKDEFVPVSVPFRGYKPGTIVIDTQKKYLYFVESPVSAVRYGVAVGKEGLLFTGKATVGAKQPWPRWIPTKEMVARDPKQYARYTDGMDGGPDNPLGARAIYLYQGKQDTYLRIHGTTQPQSIGTASSNGCFRMINEHVMDLYTRVQMGAEVVVK